MTTAIEMATTGKVTEVREGLVVFSPTGTRYELHLVCPGYSGPINKPVSGVIHIKARKIYTVPSGGLFITPIFGRPTIVQGRVRSVDEKSMVLHAGGNFLVELPDDSSALDLVNGGLTVGRMANVVTAPGATFEPR